jgi:cutinase
MGIYRGMIAGNVTRLLAPAVLAAAGVCGSVVSASAAPIASAQGCPDVEVLFARGTGEDPGVGPTGQAFGTPALTSSPPRQAARRPRWCSAVTPKARP